MRAVCSAVIACWSLSARRAWIEICWGTAVIAFLSVALRKESVDRNGKHAQGPLHRGSSLSARRAWIEIPCQGPALRGVRVALRKESVDRNKQRGIDENSGVASLSARRAWIEISVHHTAGPRKWSLSARRAWIEIGVAAETSQHPVGRSPQGERG